MSFAVAMLALLSVICIYGALASLMNSTFSQQLLPLGPRLLKVAQQQITFYVFQCGGELVVDPTLSLLLCDFRRR